MGQGLCSLPASCIHPCVGLWVLPEPPTKNGQHRAEQGSCCPKTSRSDSEGSLGKSFLKQLLLNAGGIIFLLLPQSQAQRKGGCKGRSEPELLRCVILGGDAGLWQQCKSLRMLQARGAGCVL